MTIKILGNIPQVNQSNFHCHQCYEIAHAGYKITVGPQPFSNQNKPVKHVTTLPLKITKFQSSIQHTHSK